MLLSIANLTSVLRGLKHNDDVPAHRFQAADREPQATCRCRCRTELVFRETLILLQKYQQSKGEYRVYSARLMVGGVVLHKAIFVRKTRGRRSSSNQSILKRDERATSLKYWSSSSNIHQVIIIWTLFRITPSYPWGSILKHTLICQVLRLGYSSLWS